jgi:hypothetical protein
MKQFLFLRNVVHLPILLSNKGFQHFSGTALRSLGILFLLLWATTTQHLRAQNSLNSGDFVGGSWGVGQAMSASAGGSLIITKTVATSGDKFFRFYGDGSPCGEYQPNTNGDFFTHNVAVTAPNGNCGSANAWRVNVPTATSTVVFKTDGGNDGIDRSIVYVIQGAVQSVSSVAQSPVAASVFPGQAVTVTATLSGAFATGQAAYLRYSTDNFATSTVVAMTGGSPSATIPATANTPGAVVRYYVFTSGNVAPASNGSDADFSTINLNNNGGSNYSYTVASGWTTAAPGNWGTAATWTANAVPPTTLSMGTVNINHNVTGDVNAVVGALNISGTSTLTQNTGVTLQTTGAVTITAGGIYNMNGSLQINAGGFVNATGTLNYGATSTLIYNSGGTYGVSNEWIANALTGQRVPANVTIGNGVNTTLSFGTANQYRRLTGNITISGSSGLTLSSVSGGDLRVGGNWTSNGTFTPSGRIVYFDGTAAQAINSSTTFAGLVISNTTADVSFLGLGLTVTSSLVVDAGARLDLGSNAITLTGSTSVVNGFLRRGGTFNGSLTGVTTTTLTFSSTGTYEHYFTTIAGTVPTATWNSGSTCLIAGYTSNTTQTGGLSGQAFSNFTWNCPLQTGTINLTGALTTINGNFTMASTGSSTTGLRLAGSSITTVNIGGNLILSGGILDISSGISGNSMTINLSGNFSQSGGEMRKSGAATGTINFNKSSGVQTISKTSGTISGNINWNVGTGSSTNTLQLLSNVALGTGTGTFASLNNASTDFGIYILSGSGTFSAATGTTLISANADGINSSGASGSVQTTTRTFNNAGVNYTYNGTVAQNTGSAPGAVTSINNLTINNAANVSITPVDVTVNGSVIFQNGKLLPYNNLFMGASASFSGVTSARYIDTDTPAGAGGVWKNSLSGSFLFPLGSATSYNPITITNSGTADNIGTALIASVPPDANDPTRCVNRHWYIAEATAGGSILSFVAQYNSGEEGTNYNAGTTPYVGIYHPLDGWSMTTATLAGSNPFTATSNTSLAPTEIFSTPYVAIGKDAGLAVPPVSYTWTGSTSTDWGTSTNWSPNGVPTAADDVTISSPGTNTLSINSARTIKNFTVSGTGTFTTTAAGSLTITGNVTSTTSAAVTLDCASTVTISNASAQTIPAWNFGNLNATGGNRTLASSGTIGICGTFTPGAGTYTITGSTVNFNGTGAQTINAITYNNLTISGNRGGAAITLPAGTINVLGNGSCTASNNTWVNTGSTVDYNGTGAQTVAAISGYRNLTISGAKGGATVTLEAGTIGVDATFTASATAVTYSSTGNTFDYRSTGAQTITAFPSYNHLSNSGNGTRTLANGTIGIGGIYTPTTAAVTVGTSVVNFYSASSQPIPATSYFTITNTGNGDRVWANSGNIDIAGNFTPGSGTHTITGSTVRFINTAAGPTTIPAVTTNVAGSSYNNVVINGTNGTPSVHRISGTVGIAGDLTITAGTLRLATTASSGTLNVNGTLTMNGGTLSLTNSGTLSDVGQLNLLGNLNMVSGTISRASSVDNGFIRFVHPTATQTWTYSGGSFSILSGFGIPVSVGNGLSTNTLQLATSVTASSITLTVFNGSTIDFGTNIFSGGMSFVTSSGANVITANTGGLSSSGFSGSVQSTGSRTFNAATNYTYNGSLAQITGTAVTAANNLTINNSAGVTLTSPLTVSGVLAFNSGSLTLGSNNLTVSNNSVSAITGAGSSSFVQTNSTGLLCRAIAGSIGSSTTYNFPVGTSTDYTPASFTFTATGNAFTLHTRAVAGTHPSMNSNGTQTDYFANRYWVTSTSGTPSTYSYTSQFTYISGDAQGTLANIRLNKWSGTWTEDSGSSATSTVLSSGSLNETSFSLSATAEWTGRVNPTVVTYTWNGSVSTDWANPNNWTPNTSVAGPTFNDNVIISSVGTNMLSINSARSIADFTVSGSGDFTITSAGSLAISGALSSTTSATPTLDCASTVTISSTASQTIPAWSFGNLNATGGDRVLTSSGTISICGAFTRGAGAYTITGSTVNFNGTGAQTIPIGTYNNLTISQNRGGATLTLPSGTIDIAGTFSASVSNYTPSFTGNFVNFSGAAGQVIPAFRYNTINNSSNTARVLDSSGTIYVASNFSPGTGTYTTTGSTMEFNGDATQIIPSLISSNLHNVVISASSTSFQKIMSTSSSNHIFNGNLTINGGTFIITVSTVNLNLTVQGNLVVNGGIFQQSTGFTNTFTCNGNVTINGGTFFVSRNNLGHTTNFNGDFTINAGTFNYSDGGTATTSTVGVNHAGNFFGNGGVITVSGGTATSKGRWFFTATTDRTYSQTSTTISDVLFTRSGVGGNLDLISNLNCSDCGFTIQTGSAVDAGLNVFNISSSDATITNENFTINTTGLLITGSGSGLAGTVNLTGTTPPTWSVSSTAYLEYTGTNPVTGLASVPVTQLARLVWNGSGTLAMDNNVTVSDQLNMNSNGFINLSSFNLTLSSAATLSGPFSASRMIRADGSGILIRSISNTGVGLPFTWPIGETTAPNTDYSPVTITSIGSPGISGTIGFRVVDGASPFNGLATSYLTRYWPCTVTGFNSTYTLSGASFTYDPTNDVVVGPEASLKVSSYSTAISAWTEYTSSVSSPVISTSSINGVSMPSGATYDVTARIDVPVYYRSITSGSWASASTWEVATDIGFTSPLPAVAGPNNINSIGIFVRNGHTVTVSASVNVDDLIIQSGGVVNVTNNSFTVANGTASTDLTVDSGGTLQFSSASNNALVVNSGAVLQINGLMKQSGLGSPDVTNSGTINIGASGTYEHARNAGAIPTCNWASGSTCLLTGITNNMATGLAQSFHHFNVNSTITASVNCSGALQTVNGKMKITTNHPTFGFRLSTGTSFTLTVGDSLIVNNGVLDIASAGLGPCNVVANGPVLIDGASLVTKTGASTANWTFNSNFIQNAGTFEFNSGGSSNTTVNFRGDVVMNGTILRTNGGTHTVNFNKTSGNQTWSFGGTFGTGLFNWNVGSGSTSNTVQLLSNIPLSTSAHVFTVANGAILNCGPYVLSGTNTGFTVNATGGIKIGHASGIVTAPTADGNIQTLTRSFPGTASYFYNGTANQVTGNALPTTLSGTGNLNIEASPGVTVTLTNNNTTTPTFNLISGLFAAGNTQQLNIASGGTVNATGGDWVTGPNAGLLSFPGSGTFTGNSNPYNVYISGGVNFGTGTVTIQNGGTFRINPGGFVNTNAPFYAVGSTLQYWVNTTYGRGFEWSASSGRGFPHHVSLGNNSLLIAAATGAVNASVPFRTGGNVSIDLNSAVYMDFGGNNMIEDLVVGGNLSMTGSLSGSATSGSDIYVAGDWVNNGSSTNFFPNGRAVFLNGTGTQTISGSNPSFPSFPFLLIDKTSGSVDLARNVDVSNTLTFTAANTALINTGSFIMSMGSAASAVNRAGLGHVNGNMRKTFSAPASYLLTIGDATSYTPVDAVANVVSSIGTITAFTSTPDHPQIATSALDGNKSVNRYWTIHPINIPNYNATFNFVAGDLDGGVNTSNLLVGRYLSSAWSYPTMGTQAATSTQATGITSTLIGPPHEFVLAECKQPSAFTVTGGGSYCSGGSGMPVGLSGSEAFVSYQLQRNNVNIGSPVIGTGAAISFGNQTADSTYTVIATNLAGGGCSASMTGSVVITIIPTVTPSVTIASNPGGSICAGTSVTFSATGQFGGLTPTYQWQLNGGNVGTNSTTYINAALANGDVVRCIMTSSETCPAPAADTSNVITMTVLPFQTPTISITASPSNNICSGDVVTFAAATTFGGGSPTYQWRLNGSNFGTNNDTLVYGAFANGDQVDCILTSDYQCLLAPTANSNVVTMNVTAAPQVNAGSAMTTCGLTPYTFANGASFSNSLGVIWTENGAGSITAGATTLTPTYTPAAGDIGNTVTFTLTSTGNGICGAAIDQVTLTVTPLLNWYVDADGDGFGAPGIPVVACTNPGGRVTNNQDCCDTNADVNPLTEWWADLDGDGYGSFVFDNGCFTGVSCSNTTWLGLIPYYPGAHSNIPYALDCNDNQVSVNPGMNEVCGNNTDDDCNGTIDVGCNSPQNDAFTNATSVTVNNPNAYYPNCQIMNGSVANAGISSQGNPANVSVGAGRDVWYRFIAPTTGVQIKVQPAGFDAVIELRTAAHPVGQVDVENANNTIGGLEILNNVSLTAGTTYYVGVRNYNATNTGTFTICISPLLQSGCGLAVPVGGFSTCANYKAIYRGAATYTFNFTGTGGTAPLVTTVGTTAGLIPLSTPALDIRYGGIYSCRVDANYALVNGVGTPEPMTILGSTATANCTNIQIINQPNVEVRASQRCPAAITRSTFLVGTAVTGNTIICGATGYRYRFTKVTDCTGTVTAGLPFTQDTPGSTPFLNLASVFPSALPNVGYWRVEIAPIFSYGLGNYGPAQTIQVTGTSASMMLPETNEGFDAEKSNDAGALSGIYPNPNNGEMVYINVSGLDDNALDLRIFDAFGKLVTEKQYAVEGSLNTVLVFEQRLVSGLYTIELRSGSTILKEKMVVQN